MMVRLKQQLIIILFLLIVFVPAVILSYFAVRAVNQEEMVQKRQLEDTLLLELDRTNTILRLTIDSIVQELHESSPDITGSDYEKKLLSWKETEALAGIPFILSEDRSIIYPDIRSSSSAEKKTADLFHWRYLNLFSNSESIPVYKNIAEAYETDILETEDSELRKEKVLSYDIAENSLQVEKALPEEKQKPDTGPYTGKEEASEEGIDNTLDIRKETEFAGALQAASADKRSMEYSKEKNSLYPAADDIYMDIRETENTSSESGIEPDLPAEKNMISEEELPTASRDTEKKEEAGLAESSAARSKKAFKIFESDTAVQEQIYTKAEEEGQQYLTRNLIPQIALTERTEIPQTVIRSVYIESSKYFNEITSGSDYGIIPRTFDSTFILLFWEKKGDRITGCEINMEEFSRRLTEAAGSTENSFRYINIIDRSGTPLIDFSGIESGKWRKPFVAKEISELLPYWETAILLKNPEEVEKQIQSSRYFMLLLVLFLCMLIFTGITAVYRYSSSRLKNVQQRVGFVTNVSHELKTPLTSIRMYSEMMSEGFQKDPEKIKKYSGYIASESQRLTRLINNVLDFAKLEKGTKRFNPEICDINEIIRSIIPAFEEDCGRNGFKLDISLSRSPLYVNCDREGIIQVFINLFSNAFKYSVSEKYIKISSEAENSRVSVSIEDRGKGIHRKHRKKIFRDFYRIDTSITSDSKGTGLGLAIAKKIMKQHGGDLVFSQASRDDYRKGSIFTLLLPEAENRG